MEVPGGGKRISLFVGVASGWDSNIPRASDAEGDAFLQTLAGIGLRFGNGRNLFQLYYQTRQETFSDRSEYDLNENILLGGFDVGSRKVRLSIKGEFSELADPVQIEALTLPLMERTRTAYAPELVLALGKMELSAGYSWKSVNYDDPALEKLDFTETALQAELRLARSGGGGVFLHWDSGRMDYTENINSDFEFQRAYIGWRGEHGGEEGARTLGLELGIGTSLLDEFGLDPALSEERFFALARATFLLAGGRSSLTLACTKGPEAAATARYKDALRALMRFSRTVNRRWGWFIGAKLESAEFTNPDPGTPTELSVTELDAGLHIEIGSPQKTHGRLYFRLSSETRTGDVGSLEYDRTKFLSGLALVY